MFMPLLADQTTAMKAMLLAMFAVKAACTVMINDSFKVPGLAIHWGIHA